MRSPLKLGCAGPRPATDFCADSVGSVVGAAATRLSVLPSGPYHEHLCDLPASDVLRLLNFFIDLCMLRRAPQDLPASQSLLMIILVLNALAGILLGVQTWAGAGVALAATVVDIGVLLGLLWLALRVRGLVPRFTQSATALLGAGTLFTLLAMPLQPLLDAPDDVRVGALLYLLLLAWVQLVYGHVLRHALNLNLISGIGLSLIYTFTSAVVIELLFPLPVS